MNILIDGNNLLHRAYWISQNNSNKGFNGLCLSIFLKSLRTYIETFRPNKLYIAWDKKICWPSTNFRKTELNIEYKGNRDKSNSDDVYSHEEPLERLCKSLGVCNFYPHKLEADDVISWLTTVMQPNIIVTADKDMLQLVSGTTSYYHITKKKLITPENFEEEVGIPLSAYVYYKAILGDPSDNIPGFKGHGKVRSKRLAIELDKNDGDVSKLNLSDEYLNIFERNMKICNLDKSWENESYTEVNAYNNQLQESFELKPNFNKFEELCHEYELNSILKNIEDWKAIFTFKEKQPNIIDVLV